jgi:thiol:disulfide interchange protein
MKTLFRSLGILPFLLIVSLGVTTSLRADSSTKADHLQVQLLVPESTLVPGQPFHAGLYFKLEPKWHVYWTNAGDSGQPPRIHWQLPDGVTAGDMQFPTPRRLPLGPLMDYGYEDEVLFPIAMKTEPDLKAGEVHLSAKVDWLVCREVCLPGKAILDVTRKVDASGASASSAQPDRQIFDRLSGKLPQPLPAQGSAVFAPTPEGFKLAVLTGKREKDAQFFPLGQNILDNPASQAAEPTDRGVILTLKKDQNLAKLPDEIRGVVTLASGQGYEFTARPGTLPAASTTVGATGLLRISGLAFLGGVILNLMPCVFPVLFLKGLALVQSSGEERSRMSKHGLVYTLGILVSFWIVVGALLALRAGGQQLGWGFQFQSPVFLAMMTMLLFFLGLSLAGQFEIGLLLTSAGSSLAQKQGYAGSFFTGVLATVVATPCTAPFMGAAIGYALSQNALVTFTVFSALALGLAAPYVLLTLRPEWTRMLPKPGVWMEVLKQATAIPIFGTVIWLIWVFTQSAGPNALVGLLAALLLLAVTGWILGRWPAKRVASFVGVIVLLAAVAVSLWSIRNLSSHPTMQARNSGLQWEPWTPDAVEKYRVQGRAVFVDFTASWCLSCQVNERVVLDRGDVQSQFAQSGVALLRADWTQRDESIEQALAKLGRNGVPTYALYLPGQPNPQVLPEVLTTGIIFDALSNVKPTKEARLKPEEGVQ